MDQERYGQLLAETRPGIIDSPEEHERLLSVAERLMEKADRLTEEEERVLALIVFVVEAYEASMDSEDDDEESGGQPARPHETLQRLMSARGLELGDIADIFGNPHIAREVLAGKRTITRGQAKELGRFFQAPLKIFLE